MKNVFCIVILWCVACAQNTCNAQESTSVSRDSVEKSEIWFEPEQQAYYLNGGTKGLLNDLYSQLLKTAPTDEECDPSRAVVRFSISKEGKIEPNSIKVIMNRSVPDDYLNAAIEAIKNLGNFEPGKMNGIPKRVFYNLPILYPVPLHHIKTKE